MCRLYLLPMSAHFKNLRGPTPSKSFTLLGPVNPSPKRQVYFRPPSQARFFLWGLVSKSQNKTLLFGIQDDNFFFLFSRRKEEFFILWTFAHLVSCETPLTSFPHSDLSYSFERNFDSFWNIVAFSYSLWPPFVEYQTGRTASYLLAA